MLRDWVAEINNPSKAAFVHRLARASVSPCNYTSVVHFLGLDVGFLPAQPSKS